MRGDEGAVVEIQPAGLSTTHNQARYKILAAMLGRKYLLAEAEAVLLGQGGAGSAADMEQNHGGDKPTAVESSWLGETRYLRSMKTYSWPKLVGLSRRWWSKGRRGIVERMQY